MLESKLMSLLSLVAMNYYWLTESGELSFVCGGGDKLGVILLNFYVSEQ